MFALMSVLRSRLAIARRAEPGSMRSVEYQRFISACRSRTR